MNSETNYIILNADWKITSMHIEVNEEKKQEWKFSQRNLHLSAKGNKSPIYYLTTANDTGRFFLF